MVHIIGVGKTTLIRKICEELTKNNSKVQGFYTEELQNETNTRIGFDIIDLDGNRGRLARTV